MSNTFERPLEPQTPDFNRDMNGSISGSKPPRKSEKKGLPAWRLERWRTDGWGFWNFAISSIYFTIINPNWTYRWPVVICYFQYLGEEYAAYLKDTGVYYESHESHFRPRDMLLRDTGRRTYKITSWWAAGNGQHAATLWIAGPDVFVSPYFIRLWRDWYDTVLIMFARYSFRASAVTKLAYWWDGSVMKVCTISESD